MPASAMPWSWPAGSRKGAPPIGRPVDLAPEDSRFRLRLGDALEKLGQAKAATDQYVVAFELVSDTSEVYARLAHIVADRLAADADDSDAHDRAEYLSVLPVPKGWQRPAMPARSWTTAWAAAMAVSFPCGCSSPRMRHGQSVETPVAGLVFELEGATVCNGPLVHPGGRQACFIRISMPTCPKTGSCPLPVLHAGNRAVVDPDRPRARCVAARPF